MVGELSLPHQPAIQDAVIHVLPAKPANPRAAGGAMGVRVMRTSGSRLMNESTFWTSWEFKAMAGYSASKKLFVCRDPKESLRYPKNAREKRKEDS